MHYEEPNMDVIFLNQLDIVRTSDEVPPDLDPDGVGGDKENFG